MANDVEHLFMYLCAIHMSSLEKSCNWIVSFFVVELREFVYIIDISPLLEICFANTFSHHEGCLDPVLQSTNVF